MTLNFVERLKINHRAKVREQAQREAELKRLVKREFKYLMPKLNDLILRTPTGPDRELLTSLNISLCLLGDMK